MTDTVRVVDALTGRVPVGTTVVVKGWIRNRRDSKAGGGLAFLTVHDGSCFDAIQVVARAVAAQLRDARWPGSPPAAR